MSREHRVIGPPGCGKTTYLTRQAGVAAEKYGGRGVVIASLTKAAAKEVASRAKGVPAENVGTLHAHAFRRLGRPPIAESTRGVKAWNEYTSHAAWRLSGKVVANPEYGEMLDEHFDDGGDALLEQVGMYRAMMRDEKLWPSNARRFYKEWCEFKGSYGYRDFTDLIALAIEEGVSIDAGVLFLDEAQDMSRLEMTLARRWSESCEQIVIVGDPDQNLYQWRGSEPEAFYAAEAASERVLTQSFRVPRAVHGRAVAWIEGTPGRRAVQYEPTEEKGLVVEHLSMTYKDGMGIARLIEELSTKGTVMVLASCGYMLAHLSGHLLDVGVPFHNPYRPSHGGWNPLSGAERLLAFLRPSSAVWGDESRLWTWDDVRRWTDPLIAKGNIRRGMKDLIKSKAKGGKFDDEQDRMILRIQDVLECFEEGVYDHVVDLDAEWWYEHLQHAAHKSQRKTMNIYREQGGKGLRETPKIVIGTIHSVKGGEADSVIVAPDLSRSAYEAWVSPGRDPTGHAGIYRQFYVAMTRARHELHLLGPASGLSVTL